MWEFFFPRDRRRCSATQTERVIRPVGPSLSARKVFPNRTAPHRTAPTAATTMETKFARNNF
jgi:hypothetical protein